MIHRPVLLCACLSLSLLSAAPDALTAAGRVVTVAGNGRSAYTGDGGPASRATIGGPFGVSLGPDGALYVCEIDNHCVRRIDRRTGLISTVAGSGKPGFPVPATVLIVWVRASTRRTRWFFISTKYMLPTESNRTS